MPSSMAARASSRGTSGRALSSSTRLSSRRTRRARTACSRAFHSTESARTRREAMCSSMSARLTGAASRMRASRSRSSRSTATISSWRESPCGSAKCAPRPLVSVKRPSPPGRRRPMRSGKASANSPPAEPPLGASQAIRVGRPRRAAAAGRVRCAGLDAAPRDPFHGPALPPQSLDSPANVGIPGCRRAAQEIPLRQQRREIGGERQGACPLARSSMCASRGCTPSRVISRPCGVMRPPVSRAPSRSSKSRALASMATGGGSSHLSAAASRTPHPASSSARGVRSASTISAGLNGARLRCAPSLQAR